jgi:predicted regulator of Ras-like GTPase activity (Roadblock/LC7/MglB family)
MADYAKILESIHSDVSGFIGASIVDLDSGMTLAVRSAVPDFDLEVASAYNSEMVKSKFKTMSALGLRTTLEDMLLTLGDQLHLIKLMDNNTAFVYVAANRANTNLALLRRSVVQHTS